MVVRTELAHPSKLVCAIAKDYDFKKVEELETQERKTRLMAEHVRHMTKQLASPTSLDDDSVAVARTLVSLMTLKANSAVACSIYERPQT